LHWNDGVLGLVEFGFFLRYKPQIRDKKSDTFHFFVPIIPYDINGDATLLGLNQSLAIWVRTLYYPSTMQWRLPWTKF